jgi:hypothetical protein
MMVGGIFAPGRIAAWILGMPLAIPALCTAASCGSSAKSPAGCLINSDWCHWVASAA